MNKRATKLFVVISDNQLLYCNTNLKALHASAISISGYTDSYITLFRRFQASESFSIKIDGKEYHFQKFVSQIEPKEAKPVPVKKVSAVKKLSRNEVKELTKAELWKQMNKK